ncbi:MAG TPA: RibD family protein [Anaerolineae bacterium]|nr:RibD family protein [Anaerolineae bacterium]HID84277.1 RibD family protein [Anaerolineales bacterium]HIQ08195.1 RibD family protein [Anaerolineaceae bacterium]
MRPEPAPQVPDPVAEIRASMRDCPTHGRPLVTLTYAQSLDGSISYRPDAPLTLSGPETKHLTHRLRAAHDAILVGVGTVLADDPKLTARRVGGPHPLPVVLDSHLRTPPTARVLRHPRGCLLATTPEAPQEREAALRAQGARMVRLPRDGEGVSLPALLAWLYEEGVRSLMVEGGRRVLTAFLKAGLVDWVLLTIVPYFVGGVPAIAPLPPREPHPQSVEAFPGLSPDWKVTRLGRDLVLWGRMAGAQ